MTQAVCNIHTPCKTVTRRAALTGAAAIAVACPSPSRRALRPSDPVYAAIKAYQDGYAHHAACLEKADAIEEVFLLNGANSTRD